MLRVMKMDLIMNRVALVSNLIIMTGFLAFMASWEEGASRGAFAFFSGIMMAFIPVMVVTREDKFKAMALGCSLPVTRKTIVRARYVLAVGSSVMGILLALTVGSLAPTSNFGAGELFQMGVVFHALSVATLVVAIILPFTLRFGAMGLILVLVFFQVLGIVALTLVKATESSADKRFIDSIIQGVGDLYAWAGPLGFYPGLLAFLFLVLLVSYALSVRVFRTREF
jgi:hypothetical protein